MILIAATAAGTAGLTLWVGVDFGQLVQFAFKHPSLRVFEQTIGIFPPHADPMLSSWTLAWIALEASQLLVPPVAGWSGSPARPSVSPRYSAGWSAFFLQFDII